MPPAPQLHVRHDGMAARSAPPRLVIHSRWVPASSGRPHLRATVDLMLAMVFR